MREIIYKFETRGGYRTDASTSFGDDSRVKVIVEPHDFSIAISGEVLRSSSCPGCTAIISNDGAVVFRDMADKEIARAEKGEERYVWFVLEWKQDLIAIRFVRQVTVDYYPFCDGEHDRWGTKLETRRMVKLNLKENTVEVE